MEEALKVRDYFKGLEFHTSKGKDFKLWCEVLDLIEAKRHTTKEGILEICKLRDQMNQRLVKKKWVTEEVETILNENPVHILSHFDPTQQQLLHNNTSLTSAWLEKNQGNNKPTK